MVAGNMDHYFYLEKHDQDKKDILLWKDARRHKTHIMGGLGNHMASNALWGCVGNPR